MTVANSERKALYGLEPAGVRCWLPTFLDDRRRPRLLFRNYIFALYERETASLLSKTPGCIKPVGTSNGPSLMSETQMASLRARANKDGHIILDDEPTTINEPRFTPGQSIRVIKGSMNGALLIYKGMSASMREVALLSLLGRSVAREFSPGELEAA